MKLYREVKCGDYTVHKDMGHYTEKVCHVEPYELPTEEEIEQILMEHSELRRTNRYILKFKFKPIAKAITNLLKGEKK